MKMNAKKILSMVMSAAMTCTMCVNFPSERSLTVNAVNYSDALQYDDYLICSKVDEDDDGIYDYIEISECDTSATEIDIPSEIDGLPVTSIGYAAFGDCSSLVSITIPDSVTGIRNYAFDNCSSLESITIPDSVTSIENEAFNNSSSLTSINVSENNKYYSSIDGTLFNKDKTELITVPRGIGKYVIPDGVTSIGRSAFSSCDDLTSIIIPDGVTGIGDFAFSGCSSLTSITIPDSVTSIGNDAFSDCSSLESVTIGDGVTSIGDGAFHGCSSLKSITIPDSVTSIGYGAFFGCSSLKSITIPDSITSIVSSAFSGCSSLTSITIPDSVTSIGEDAFYGCSNLKSITIENAECEIFDNACTICNGNDENGSSYYSGIIYGYKNSTAETYALNYGMNFAALDEITNPGESISIGSAFAEPGSVVELPVNVSCNDNFEAADVVISFPSELTALSVEAVASCTVDSVIETSKILTVLFTDSNHGAIADGPVATIKFEIPKDAKVGTVYNIDFSKIEVFAIWGGDDIYDTVAAYGGTITVIDNSSDNNDNHLYYKLIDEDEDGTDDYVEITGCDESVTEIEIPAEIDGLPVTSIGGQAFDGCSILKSITIPDSVTSIGDSAFASCSSLTSITIPGSVTSIGSFTFYECKSLERVMIPESVTDIWNSAFAGCSSLTSITIPDSVTGIGFYAFESCSSLKNVTIPDSVTAIGDFAFYNCSNLKSITIENPDCEIFDNACTICNGNDENDSIYYSGIIYGYKNSTAEVYAEKYGYNFAALDEITNPRESISIGSAFAEPGSVVELPINVSCNDNFESSSVKISFPEELKAHKAEGVSSCGCASDVGDGCVAVVSYTYSNAPVSDGMIASIEFEIPKDAKVGTVYNIDFSKIEVFGIWGGDDIYDTVAAYGGKITVIDNSSDNNDDHLYYKLIDEDDDGIYDYIEISECDTSATEIEIPAEIDGLPVKSIGNDAFSDCSSLKSITIPDSVTSIGEHAFEMCSSLTSINVSENNEYYSSEDGILFNKDKTELIKFPKSSKITEYVIPDGITSIGDSAFYECRSLESVTIPDSVTSIGEFAFSWCDSLTSITIPDSVTTIECGVFSGCSSLENITIPDSVTSIGSEGFRYCSSLESITIPDSVTTIEWGAFLGCSNLENITIPDSVTSIGECAFYSCSSLTSINVSGNNKYYSSEDGVLFNKDKTDLIKYPESSKITEYIIPDSVTSIGEGAFSGCSGLTSITIPDGVTSIGDSAFEYCSGLTSITIPDGVTSIEYRTFLGCSSLESVTIPDSVTSIGDCAFSYCSSLTSITIPDSVTSIGDWAFWCCSNLESITIENPDCEIYDSSDTICNGYDENGSGYYSGIIYGFENSTAEVYAEKYGYKFALIGDEPVVTEPTEPVTTEPVETTKPIETTEPAETTTLIETTESAETTTLIETTESAETTTPIETTESAETTKLIETTESAETTTPIETTESAETTTLIETTEPVETTKPIETTEPVEITRPVGTTTAPTTEDPAVTTTEPIKGDPNGDGVVNVRDAAHIAKMLAQGKASDLPENSDFNGDGKINVRDAAAIAKYLAAGKK